MGDYANGPVYNVTAWLTALVVSALSLLLVARTLFGGAS
jgi:Mn2+/Fe2+ NRAMP family transporter